MLGMPGTVAACPACPTSRWARVSRPHLHGGPEVSPPARRRPAVGGFGGVGRPAPSAAQHALLAPRPRSAIIVPEDSSMGEENLDAVVNEVVAEARLRPDELRPEERAFLKEHALK